MADEELKRRIFINSTHLQAFKLLIVKKRELHTVASQWAQLHQAQLWTRRLEQQVEGLDEAARQVKIAAIAGVATLIGGAVVTAHLARIRGIGYLAGRAATVPLRPLTLTNAAGQTLTLTRIIPFSLRSWLKYTLMAAPISSGTGSAIAKAATGATAAGLVFGWLFREQPVSDQEYKQLRDQLTAEGIGSPEFQALVKDPATTREKLRQQLRPIVDEMVLAHMSERLQFIENPLAGLITMDSGERARWYSEFRGAVERAIDQTFPKRSADERAILRQSAQMDFWIDVINSLDAEEAYLARSIDLLDKAVKDDEFSLFNNQLSRAQQAQQAKPQPAPARR